MQDLPSEGIIVGLTGSFGSGCTLVAKILEKEFDFKAFRLSDFIKKEARKRGVGDSNRWKLQDIGNELRKKRRRDFLVRKTLEKARKEGVKKPLVLDGIRNTGEIDSLRNYSNFYLIAVDCSFDYRWERLKERYKGDKERFLKEDRRDKDEGIDHGQQVMKCVERADIIFSNEYDYPDEDERSHKLALELIRYVKLIKERDTDIFPTPDEAIMTLASSYALCSSCLKRKVGAVICDKFGNVISIGYNEVPVGEKSCNDLYGMCFRDKKKQELKSKDYKLPKYLSLRDYERVICAERNAIYNCQFPDLSEATLYTTTFPCTECVKAIIQKRIKRVVYIHPYPDQDIGISLMGRTKVEKFIGVKARTFYKLFS